LKKPEVTVSRKKNQRGGIAHPLSKVAYANNIRLG